MSQIRFIMAEFALVPKLYILKAGANLGLSKNESAHMFLGDSNLCKGVRI